MEGLLSTGPTPSSFTEVDRQNISKRRLRVYAACRREQIIYFKEEDKGYIQIGWLMACLSEDVNKDISQIISQGILTVHFLLYILEYT